jgi:DNA-directed RNA polymerase specialized sigma24 family protein
VLRSRIGRYWVGDQTLHDDAGDDTNAEQQEETLRRRLSDAWHGQRYLAFYQLVQDELIPKIHRGLRPEFRTLSDEDLDDCISEAVTAFVRRSDATISNPESYIWTSARNQARDLMEDRARRQQVEEASGDGDLADGIGENDAVILIEGLVEDVDAKPFWAVEVVHVAIERLRPALRRTILYVLTNGTDCDAASAAQALGTTPVTYRANKSNAYSALRSLIPVVIAEKGIVPPTPRLAELFTEQHEFAKDDE